MKNSLRKRLIKLCKKYQYNFINIEYSSKEICTLKVGADISNFKELEYYQLKLEAKVVHFSYAFGENACIVFASRLFPPFVYSFVDDFGDQIIQSIFDEVHKLNLKTFKISDFQICRVIIREE